MKKEFRMTVNSNVDETTGGSQSTQETIPSGDQESKKDFVQYDTYKKVLNQEKSLRERLNQLNSELEKFKQIEQEREEKKLTEDGELKKLLALKEKEISRFKEENSVLNQKWDDAIKLSALRDKLPGPVRDEDCYSILRKRLKDIVVDPETGDIVEESVTAVAEDLVKNKIYLFDVKQGSGLPANSPQNTSTGKLTPEQWSKLPLKEKKARMKDII